MRMTPPSDQDEGPSPAFRRIAGPAIGLIVTGCIGLFGNCLCGFGMAALSQNPGGGSRPAGMSDEDYRLYQDGRASAAFLQLCGMAIPAVAVYPFVIYSGIRLKGLRDRGLGIVCSILAMFPCGPAFLLGLPIGIWALIVLMDPEVKAAFR